MEPQKISFVFLYAFLLLICQILFAQPKGQIMEMDDCDKVQLLLTSLHEFKGDLINDNAYECKNSYILEGFTEARVIVPGNEGKFWTVNMSTEDMQQVEAESKYLLLVQELMKCAYLNSWKGGETIIGDGIYHYNFKQSISSSGYYKNVLISYYKVKNAELYKVELTLTN